tara:strand:+ start:1163 stop:1393 length:231 start_codon:yes stop_codon:yes gene_type:complete
MEALTESDPKELTRKNLTHKNLSAKIYPQKSFAISDFDKQCNCYIGLKMWGQGHGQNDNWFAYRWAVSPPRFAHGK